MTRLGFLIDQDTCIGCHACTVACKSEHSVPLTVNRTWVKYIEKGTFPDVRRLFSVMRCNHCDDAPCITICPTGALYRREDGIVDFNTSSCIGCKSCMNACPYDALYIDPDEHTAQKCNFCAHRIDAGLEPSCVVVCPTQSIITGDLDDPGSRIATMISQHDVQVRAPEQGTRPKLFYKGADDASLDPHRTAIAADGMVWAETTSDHPTLPAGAARDGLTGRTAYTTAHPMPWRGMVTAYLATKSVAAGILVVAALLVVLGHADDKAAVGVLPPVLSGSFTFATGLLLVADLKQPYRFHYILTRPNWSSWLTRGAVILAIHALVSAAWFVAGLTGADSAIRVLAVAGLATGSATAGYTAFLFGQCEGRDLWQTPLLPPILLAQAVIAGASTFAVADVFVAVPAPDAIRWTLLASAVAAGLLILAESVSHGTTQAHLAQQAMTRGRYAARFWIGGIACGVFAPAGLALLALAGGPAPTAVSAVAGLLALAGLAAFEDAFVRAGQSVPLS